MFRQKFGSWSFAFVAPGSLNANATQGESIIHGQIRTAEKFWLSLGFRRVGNSNWLARSSNPNHPSRQLEAFRQLVSESKACFPPLMQIVSQHLANPQKTSADIVSQIRDVLPDDPEDPSWCCTNRAGNNLLHVAALSYRPVVIEHLMSKNPKLAFMRNHEGYTPPLEALRSRMERQRMQSGALCDWFAGFGPSKIASVGAFTGIEIFNSNVSERALVCGDDAIEMLMEDVGPDMDTFSQTLRIKYGCTCGECING